MKRKKDKRPRYGWIIALIIVILAAGFLGYMAINACTLHLRRATVYLEDLPDAFEGTTILYASDIDLGGINTPKRAGEVFKRLQALNPDLLLLGGDYTAPTLTDLLNQSDVPNYTANFSDVRRDFFYYIRDFDAPLGKYMIASPDDTLTGDLWETAEENGFHLLYNDVAEIRVGGDKLYIIESNGNADKLARHFKRDDCVLALTWSPSVFPSLMTSEASDSGHWVDLVLSAHTHGGQIRLFGRSILTLDFLEQQFIYGWNRETGVPLLVTSGMGCEGVNLRLGTQAEVWLITLTNVSRETF